MARAAAGSGPRRKGQHPPPRRRRPIAEVTTPPFPHSPLFRTEGDPAQCAEGQPGHAFTYRPATWGAVIAMQRRTNADNMYHTSLWKTPLALAAVAILAVGCKKYEDGPGVSLVPRTERVANTWVIDKAYSDGQDVTNDYDQYVLTLTTNGNATLVAEYTLLGILFSFETTGTWSFANDQEDLVLDFENDAADGTYRITRLTRSELWMREEGGNLELRLKEQ
jgi:hypothetical protein